MMRIDILTLFPEMCSPLQQSIIGRATTEKTIEINAINLRNYTHDPRQTVDDTPYGGGAGMVLLASPIKEALEDLKSAQTRIIFMSPQGKPFTQREAERLSKDSHLIFVCGHYEGIDDRVIQHYGDEIFSIGDYVLTNGTLAAMVMSDAIVRLLPGVLGKDISSEEESFDQGCMLEYPQYTKPELWEAMPVPKVLLSGNHQKISDWRQELRYLRTLSRRPDLFID